MTSLSPRLFWFNFTPLLLASCLASHLEYLMCLLHDADDELCAASVIGRFRSDGGISVRCWQDFRYFPLVYFSMLLLVFSFPSPHLFPFDFCSFPVPVVRTTGVSTSQENDWRNFGGECCSSLVDATSELSSFDVSLGRPTELSAIPVASTSTSVALQCSLPSCGVRTFELNDPISET